MRLKVAIAFSDNVDVVHFVCIDNVLYKIVVQQQILIFNDT